MDRIIDIKVCGSRVIKDGDSAGNQGEANVTKLRITFDEEWRKYVKKVTFFDAYGANPTVISLNLNNREDISDSSTYLVPIPPECLTEQGKISFVVEGEIDNKIARGFTDSLKVGHVPSTNGAINSVDPTPSDLAQCQAQLEAEFDKFLKKSQEAAEKASDSALNAEVSAGEANFFASNAREYANAALISENISQANASVAGGYAADSEASRIAAETARSESQRYANNSQEFANNASGAAARAEAAANRAENAGGGGGTGEPGKSPYIGDNGNWFEYDGTQYVDTGVKAQGEDGKPGLPNVEIHENDGSGNSYQWEYDFPAFTEIRFGYPLDHFCVYGFLRNPESNGNDMWAVSFTAATDESGYGPSVTIPNYVEWAVAEPVFTAGYTYYLSFIPLVDEGVDEYGCFKGKILGVWVAKELS